ncbi:MAG: hypothetical protein WAK40_08770 [Thermoplasmata archaeon]
MSRASAPAWHGSEAELVAIVAGHLSREGYRTYVDPDGSDYFDLVVRRDGVIGLVEAKLSQPRALLVQALRRRAWGDWVAVVVPSARTAERLAASTSGRRADPVGVWVLDGEGVRIVRTARPFPMGDDPFAAHRARFHAVLDRIDRGELPEGIRWDGLGRELGRASGGRRFREWRLDEPVGDGD